MTSSTQDPQARHLVFIGGGHSHALVLRMLGMRPLRGVRLTVISDVALAPYSGMLPGHVSGVYSHEECHIDLRRLCQFAGAAFIHGRVTGLDMAKRQVYVDGRPAIGFDVASLNTGSTPATDGVPGSREYAVAAKPVPEFLAAWSRIQAAAAQGRVRIAVAGGGAGGVELALGMQQKLGPAAEISLWHRGAQIMDTHNARVRGILTTLLRERGITVHTGVTLERVEPGGFIAGGQRHEADFVIMALNAAPASWLEGSGLALDDRGFVKVTDCLQSVSHPEFFAAGDVASMPVSLPRSGVYAVRMARPLEKNLRRYFAGETLAPYRPQRRFLSLIGTADGRAVASRGEFALHSKALWKMKDWIDRRFMEKFSSLQPMTEPVVSAATTGSADSLPQALAALQARAQMRCLGCAAKIGSSVLSRTMARLREEFPAATIQPPASLGIETGLAAADDAAVFRVPPGQRLVQTVDYMPALTADPWLFGRIATLHSFSDIFAMGAEPHSALAACLLPFGADDITGEILYQLLSGVLYELEKHGACLTGGHTAEGAVTGLALTCNGLLSDASLTKGGLQSGDALILTKPLGTGTLFAAEMRLQTRASWMDAAIASMLRSNLGASRILRSHGAVACTDITGFGLAGHLLEMLPRGGAGASLELDALPLLPGAIDTIRSGIVSSLHGHNAVAVNAIANAADFSAHPCLPLLFDPQTSGGLLAGIPSARAAACVAELQAAGYPDATIVGQIIPHDPDGALVLR